MDTLAIDIGGVNLKAAHSSGQAVCTGFALTQNPDRLVDELRAVSYRFPPFERLLVTMTGELCDCFIGKREGVEHILGAAEAIAEKRPLHVWLTEGRFCDTRQAGEQPYQCAAANWHALATAVAFQYEQETVLLVDTGSTTTDITLLKGGVVAAEGLTDLDRLASGELVYLGVDRTPVACLGPTIQWGLREVGLMAVPFATMADVLLLNGQVHEEPDRKDTCDGRPRTQQFAASRLARMVGADLEMLGISMVRSLADTMADRAVRRIGDAINLVIENNTPVRVVVAGSGEDLAAAAVERALPGVPIERLSQGIGRLNSTAACAWALLKIAEDRGVEPIGSTAASTA